jgi:hypothetical protein
VRHRRDHQLVGVGAMDQLGELAEDGFRASDDVPVRALTTSRSCCVKSYSAASSGVG